MCKSKKNKVSALSLFNKKLPKNNGKFNFDTVIYKFFENHTKNTRYTKGKSENKKNS